MMKTVPLACGKCGWGFRCPEWRLPLVAAGKIKCSRCGAVMSMPEGYEGKLGGPAGPGKALQTRPGGMLQATLKGDVAVVTFTTERIIDQLQVAQLNDELSELITKHRLSKLVVSLAGVQHISSSILNRLLRLRSQLVEAGGDLKLCHVPEKLHEVLKVMNLHKIFDIHPGVEQAVAAFDE